MHLTKDIIYTLQLSPGELQIIIDILGDTDFTYHKHEVAEKMYEELNKLK